MGNKSCIKDYTENITIKNYGEAGRSSKDYLSTTNYSNSKSNIKAGDVLIYHSGGCSSGNAHAVLVTVGGKSPKITCHSSVKIDASYDYMANSKPYYQWLHHN